MTPEEFKQARKLFRYSQREFGKKIGLSEDEVRDIEHNKIALSKTAIKSLENYKSVHSIKEIINTIKARRFENGIKLLDFCEGVGCAYEEWQKLEEF